MSTCLPKAVEVDGEAIAAPKPPALTPTTVATNRYLGGPRRSGTMRRAFGIHGGVDLASLDADARAQLARITLASAREHGPDWLPDLDAARGEIADALAPGKIARVALEGGVPVGWVAAGHDWGCVWELHPLIVAIERQRRGHGRRLVREIERLAAAAGARTLTLGTSDTTGATSLAGVDLYDDTFARLATVEACRPHAVEFWRRIGYPIVGVIPDAEGAGKPSITLARRP